MRVIFASRDERRGAILDAVGSALGAEGIPASSFEETQDLVALEPDLIVLEAGSEWAVPVAALLPEEGPAILAVASEPDASVLPALLRSGADSFLILPAGPAAIRTAARAAVQARARRRETWEQLDGARRQLMRFAEDFRSTYERERKRAEDLEESLDRLERSYGETVRSLAAAVETRDPSTGRHIERVTSVALELARLVDPAIAVEPFVGFGFLLHDLGKIGIPDAVLRKPAELTESEKSMMRLHPEVGAHIVKGIEFLRPVRTIILHHHERWDGSGYPSGLSGEEIPRAARIFSVADAADAMLHDRPYRLAMPLERVRAEIARGSGTQFDPEVVDAFLGLTEDRVTSLEQERQPERR